jgi:ABC-type branched-subunit amino acid transport system substrate-binding protein
MRDVRFEGDVITVDSLGDDELKHARAAAEGIYVSQIALVDQDFSTKLAHRFPHAPASKVNTGYSALGYDGTKFLLESISSAAAKSPKELVTSMKARSFRGTLGETRISPDGLSDRIMPIFKIVNGGFAAL